METNQFMLHSSRTSQLMFATCCLDGTQILQAKDTKYFGLHLDRHINWKKYIFSKHKHLGLKLSKMTTK